MKTLTTILTLTLITVSSTLMAQDFDVPKTGAKIYVTDNTIELSPTGEYTFDLWIVRSNKARKAKFDVPKFSGSKDMDISVEPNSEDPNNYKVTIKSKDVSAGKYFYTVTSRTTGIQRINGTTVSFNVGDVQNVAAADNK